MQRLSVRSNQEEEKMHLLFGIFYLYTSLTVFILHVDSVRDNLFPLVAAVGAR